MTKRLPPTPMTWVVYLRGEEVFGAGTTLEELGERLGNYPLEATLRVLCGFGMSFDADHPERWFDLEKTFLRPTFLRPETLSRVERLERGAATRVLAFCRPQILLALRLLPTFAPSSTAAELTTSQLHDLGDDLLRVSDVLQDSAGVPTEANAGVFLLPLYDESNPPTTIFAVKRTYDMVTDPLWDTEPILKKAAAVFKERVGLSIPDFFHCMMLPLSHCYNMKPPAISPVLDFGAILKSARDAVAIKQALTLISIPIVELPSRLGKPDAIVEDPSQEPYRSHPLILQSEERYLLTDRTLLKERLRGILWTVQDMLDPADQKTFLTARGKLFERYVHQRLSPAFKDRYRMSPTDDDGDEITDAIVDYGNQIVLLEFKGGLLAEVTKYSRDLTLIMDAVERKFLGTDQLSRALRRLLGPTKKCHGVISSDQPDAIFPVLICNDQSLIAIEHLVGNLLAEHLDRERPPGYRKVQRLTIMSADDIENLLYFVAIRGMKLSNLLAGRLRVDPLTRNSLHNYMHSLAGAGEIRAATPRSDFAAAFEGSKAFWNQQGTAEEMRIHTS